MRQMIDKIFNRVFKKRILQLEEREQEVTEREKILHRVLGNPLQIYEVFVEKATRCAFIINDKSLLPDSVIDTLDERAMELLSSERKKRQFREDLIEDEIELTVIRFIVRYYKDLGYFPDNIPYIVEDLDTLYRKGIESVGRIIELSQILGGTDIDDPTK